ncbi:MAG: single-stranded DNA-binding protein [Blautia sp.]|nr:single-stranded DNA-binding protein [Blautia sp.]
MNSVQLTGRLTRDPEVRYTDGGTSIARFTLACDRRFNSEGRPDADFISCIAFGKSAEFVEKWFAKGMKMELNGRIQTGSYTNKDGQKVYTTDVVAEQIGFAESRAASQSHAGNQSGGRPAPQTDADGFMNIPDGLDEELPF